MSIQKLFPRFLTFTLLITLCFPLVFGSLDALALSCLQLDTPRNAMNKADVVFQGVVSKATPDGKGGYFYAFNVSKVWKGEIESTVTLHQSEAEVTWSYVFNGGKEYIVMARYNDSKELVYPLCGYSLEFTGSNQSEVTSVIDDLGSFTVPSQGSATPGMQILYVVIPFLVAGAIVGFVIYQNRNSKK